MEEKTVGKSRIYWVITAALGFLGVAIGALGSHAVRHLMSAQDFTYYQTAIEYQFYHVCALGMVLFALKEKVFQIPFWFFTVGIVLFSGSLYAYSLTHIKFLAMVTPFGGFSFLLGWLSFLILAWRKK